MRLYTVTAAAQELGISRTKMHELIRAGRIRTVISGRRRMIPASALLDYAERGDLTPIPVPAAGGSQPRLVPIVAVRRR